MSLPPGLLPKGDGRLPLPYPIGISILRASPMSSIMSLLTNATLEVAAMSTNTYLAVPALKVFAFPPNKPNTRNTITQPLREAQRKGYRLPLK